MKIELANDKLTTVGPLAMPVGVTFLNVVTKDIFIKVLGHDVDFLWINLSTSCVHRAIDVWHCKFLLYELKLVPVTEV